MSKSEIFCAIFAQKICTIISEKIASVYLDHYMFEINNLSSTVLFSILLGSDGGPAVDKGATMKLYDMIWLLFFLVSSVAG